MPLCSKNAVLSGIIVCTPGPVGHFKSDNSPLATTPIYGHKKILTASGNEDLREAYWARTNDLHRVRVAL